MAKQVINIEMMKKITEWVNGLTNEWNSE